MTYTVTLVDFSDVPADVLRRAEGRFRTALDNALGEHVAPTLKAFQNASESSANELSKEDIQGAGEWATAYAKAKEAGFRGLGDADEAYFEVRLG